MFVGFKKGHFCEIQMQKGNSAFVTVARRSGHSRQEFDSASYFACRWWPQAHLSCYTRHTSPAPRHRAMNNNPQARLTTKPNWRWNRERQRWVSPLQASRRLTSSALDTKLQFLANDDQPLQSFQMSWSVPARGLLDRYIGQEVSARVGRWL